MAHTHDDFTRDKEKIPTVLVRCMALLVVATLLLVTYAKITDRPLVAAPPEGVAISKERPIIIDGEMNGAARVLDANGAMIAELSPEEGGFIAGVYRVLVRERTKHGVAIHAPIRLVLFEDGRLALRDDATGWRAELMGFGRDNHAAFARLLNP